ncbi:MAG: hypothetical protein L6R40_008600, partial [Gallowayella cf. fulva]
MPYQLTSTDQNNARREMSGVYLDMYRSSARQHEAAVKLMQQYQDKTRTTKKERAAALEETRLLTKLLNTEKGASSSASRHDSTNDDDGKVGAGTSRGAISTRFNLEHRFKKNGGGDFVEGTLADVVCKSIATRFARERESRNTGVRSGTLTDAIYHTVSGEYARTIA